ncbi:MAG: S8 family serine peptidase [Bacteroidales bacterium]|nr:S8 family serine peptidase [Bacteroidales bacterium]
MQAQNNAYFVGFGDKKGCGYELTQPYRYLSARALERRQRQQIDIDSFDLPVSAAYLERLSQRGCTVLFPLRWLNGAVVRADSLTASELSALPFVRQVQRVQRAQRAQRPSTIAGAMLAHGPHYDAPSYYAQAYEQIRQLGGDRLHERGFTGRGSVIAVLDAGFQHTDVHPMFDSLRLSGRLLGTRDFIDPSSNIYAEDAHGAMVLSTMAGLQPGIMVGASPHAQFWLIRTEDAAQEHLLEEFCWIAGAELADSVGADIITTSLGYNTFDDASQNHPYSALDGRTTPITRGANMAAQKGMLVVVSAGNEGAKPWRHITAPADSPMALTVGAANVSGTVVGFSSRGPTADGRIKPDICAMGEWVAVASGAQGVQHGSGTSFAAPIAAGLAACLWQALPNLKPSELIELIRSSASSSTAPDNDQGYGLPNFARALGYPDDGAQPINVYPNPTREALSMSFPWEHSAQAEVLLCSLMGGKVLERSLPVSMGQLRLVLPPRLQQGVYLLKVRVGERSFVSKIVKL